MKILAPAKINLFLEVINRRKDGYHNIESVMQTVSLYDELIIEPHKSDLTLKCNIPELPIDEKNLALRAAYLLRYRLGVKKGARITLKKNIPMGAGLGGGSSDAAAVLKGLLVLWKKKLPEDELSKLAAGLGADVPFFLKGGTCVAKGIGDRLEALKPAPETWFVLVNPGFPVATPWVYQNLRFPLTNKQKINRIKQLMGKGMAHSAWEDLMFNRLEDVVFRKYPKIGQIKNMLKDAGCVSIMSGSGSTVFGLVPSQDKGESVKSGLKKFKMGVWVVRSIP